MKKLVTVQEVEEAGLITLLGKKIMVFCTNYIYSGILEGVNDKVIELKDAHIVYETGPLNDAKFKDAQRVSDSLLITLSAIEAVTETSKV